MKRLSFQSIIFWVKRLRGSRIKTPGSRLEIRGVLLLFFLFIPYFSTKRVIDFLMGRKNRIFTVFHFLPYFEPKFVTLECGALESNRFDFWNQRNRISLEPKFHQNRRKFRKSWVTPLTVHEKYQSCCSNYSASKVL